MINFAELHEQLYQELLHLRKENSSLRYTFRKSNHASRLEEGYWFYGNEHYLAISFWTGMDWKNRTPNIVFIITGLGDCFLEVNVSDSDKKREFIELYLLRQLELEPHGRKYIKRYDSIQGAMDVLIDFVHQDKLIIDSIIEEHSESFFINTINGEKIEGIGFIPSDEFVKRHNKVKQYRKLIEEMEKEDFFSIKEEKPTKIQSIKINDYGLIENIELDINSKKNQWVFITGNNGAGKTNLLRAIATILGQRMLSNEELVFNPEFNSEIELLFRNNTEIKYRNENREAKGKKRPLVQGLAIYGPYRLDVSDKPMSKYKLRQELSKEGSFKSLFKQGIPLLSIDNQFNIWRKGNKKERERFEKRAYFFRSVLTDVVPDLVDVWFKGEQGVPTEYVFRDRDDNRTHCIVWKSLPSGIKSTIALLGDILIRLYDQQRFIDDPSEFKGVVIIDEIDLHLHPQGQKDLVINLTKTFPNIQFIVTTHSPIPLLGANENSIFYHVSRKYRTVTVERLEFIEKYINELMPNHLFTSELFGLESITSIRNKTKTNVFTGSSISDFYETQDLKEKKLIKDPDNLSFLEKLKTKLGEKDK